LKITAVKTYLLRHALRHAAGPGNHFYRERQALFLKLETDAGISGWGETAAFPGVRDVIHNSFAPLLAGRDPLAFRPIWRDLWGRNFGNGMAVGAVALALDDLRGKALNLPVAELYGGRLRDTVDCYFSALGYLQGVDPVEQYPRDIEAAAGQGFRAYKFRVGGHPVRKDVAALERVRAAVGPDYRLMADGNGCYSLGAALAMGRELERLGFAWFEEPLPQNTPEYTAYDTLREKLDIPLAGGEGLTARGTFKDAIARRAMDIVQPDPALAGGIAECLFVAELARLYGMPCMPHTWAGALNTAACIHLVSLLPPLSSSLHPEEPMAEIGPEENPFMDQVVVSPLEFKGGRMTVPTGPGLGVEIDEKKLASFAQ
jgi:D-galactarolactone cycloisomerase